MNKVRRDVGRAGAHVLHLDAGGIAEVELLVERQGDLVRGRRRWEAGVGGDAVRVQDERLVVDDNGDVAAGALDGGRTNSAGRQTIGRGEEGHRRAGGHGAFGDGLGLDRARIVDAIGVGDRDILGRAGYITAAAKP